jgi:hypothetical protein
MAKPTKGAMTRMKRLARYSLEVPDGIIRFNSEVDKLDKLFVYVDSDWAGCKSKRKSTSGGAVTWGGGLLKSWSRTQTCIALSSGEAEFFAAIKGSAEGIGIRSSLADMGQAVDIEVIQDSTAAKGTASRLGIGKVKDVGWLWIQDAVRNGEIVLWKINGKVNPADVLTKPKSAAEAARLTDALGYESKMRKPRIQDEERDGGFTGFTARMMKGSKEADAEKMETMSWWDMNLRRSWEEGRLTG